MKGLLFRLLICMGLWMPGLLYASIYDGWDFRKITGINVDMQPKEITVNFQSRQKIMPVRFKAIRCNELSHVKLKIRVSGKGTLNMGCHSYDKKNKWIGLIRAVPVSLDTEKTLLHEFNVQIPVSKSGKVEYIRPFLEMESDAYFVIAEFECAIRNFCRPPQGDAASEAFPEYFERLTVTPEDFPLRILPSKNRLVLDFVERPYRQDANIIQDLRIKLVSLKNRNAVASACASYHEGVIRNFQMSIPKNLSGDYRVEGEYLDRRGNLVCRGSGYSYVTMTDLDSGWYVVGGMKRNAHKKNMLESYSMGQKVFHFSDYPFQKNTVGVSPEPLPGFQHPAIAEDTISVLGRKYHFGENGLPRQITIQQPEPTVGAEWADILAAPITVVLDGKILPSDGRKQIGGVKFGAEVSNTLAGSLSLHSRIEQDGVIKLKIGLIGKLHDKVGKLSLRIPFRPEQATLFHEVTDVTYRRLDRTKTGLQAGIGDHAGKLPVAFLEGNVIWRSRDCERRMKGSFNPMVWVGNEDRGFCFFSDSDQGWLVDTDRSCLEIERLNGQVVLSINLVNRHSEFLPEGASWTIGLLATPVKAPPKGFRGTIFPRWGTLDKAFYDQLKNVRKIIEIGAGDPAFTSGSCSILPKDVQRTRDLYSACRDSAGSRYMEYWCSDYMNLAAKEMAMYFGEWSAKIEGTDLRAPSNWVKAYPGFTFAETAWISCRRIVPSYLRYRLWCLEQKLKTVGELSFYEDNMHVRCFFDPMMGYGYYLPDGNPQIQFDLWSVREYFRSIAEIFRRNAMENLAGAHASAAMLIPALTYCTFFIEGEQPARYARGPGMDYVDMWRDTDYFRASVLGRQFGVRTIFLSEITYNGTDRTEHRRQARAWLSVMLAHDVGLWDAHIKDRTSVKKWHKIVNDLDFFHQHPRLFPYWGSGKFKVADSTMPDLHITVYRQKDRALMILSNFGEAGTAAVKLLPEHLQLNWKSVVDMEEPERKDIQCGHQQIRLFIPRHDYRIVLLQDTDAKPHYGKKRGEQGYDGRVRRNSGIEK